MSSLHSLISTRDTVQVSCTVSLFLNISWTLSLDMVFRERYIACRSPILKLTSLFVLIFNTGRQMFSCHKIPKDEECTS